MRSLKLCIQLVELDATKSLIDFFMLTHAQVLCYIMSVHSGWYDWTGPLQEDLSRTSTGGGNHEREIVLIRDDTLPQPPVIYG